MLSRLGSTATLRRTAGLAPLQLARTLKSGAWIDKELGYDTCAASQLGSELPTAYSLRGGAAAGSA